MRPLFDHVGAIPRCRSDARLRLPLAALLACVVACAGADAAPDPEVVAMMNSAPIPAVIEAVEVLRHERREGMRRVRVSVRARGVSPQEVTVTEWVPVVLLGRLTVGATIQLIVDPALKQLTIGL